MKVLLSAMALLLLGACANSPGPRYLTGVQNEPASQKQAERQLIERTLYLQTIDEKLDVPIKLIHAPLPGYPEDLRAEGIRGTVRLRFVVEEDGTVGAVEVLGDPPAGLAEVSINALRAWRFVPMSVKGRPVRVRLIQTFVYRIAR